MEGGSHFVGELSAPRTAAIEPVVQQRLAQSKRVSEKSYQARGEGLADRGEIHTREKNWDDAKLKELVLRSPIPGSRILRSRILHSQPVRIGAEFGDRRALKSSY